MTINMQRAEEVRSRSAVRTLGTDSARSAHSSAGCRSMRLKLAEVTHQQ